MITSKEIARTAVRPHHNITTYVRDRKEILESIDYLEYELINVEKNKGMYVLTNLHLLYLAGTSKDDYLKKILLDFYFETKPVLPTVKKKWYQKIKLWK